MSEWRDGPVNERVCLQTTLLQQRPRSNRWKQGSTTRYFHGCSGRSVCRMQRVPEGAGLSVWEDSESIPEEDGGLLRPDLQRRPSCVMAALFPACNPKYRPTLEGILAPRNGSASLLDPRPQCICSLPLSTDSICFGPLRSNCPIGSSLWPGTSPHIGLCDGPTFSMDGKGSPAS